MAVTFQQAILDASTLPSLNTVQDHMNNLNAGGGGTVYIHDGALTLEYEVSSVDFDMDIATETLDLSLATETLECTILTEMIDWEIQQIELDISDTERICIIPTSVDTVSPSNLFTSDFGSEFD